MCLCLYICMYVCVCVYIYIYIYQKYVYHPTAESPSQPAVMWHIISHTKKDGPPKLLNAPAVKDDGSV